MKKLFTLAAAVLASFSLWAATESNPTSASKDKDVAGTSYTIPGTFVAGAGSTKVGAMPDKGIKFRLNKPAGDLSNAIEFKVNEGYVINAIQLVGITNSDNKAATVGSIYVDGVAWNGTFNGALPAKNAEAASDIQITGIEAAQSVVFVFSDLGEATQGNICYTVTYEEAQQKEVDHVVETLTAVTINDYPLAAADFTKLTTAHTLILEDSAYVTAPVVKFTKHIVITYDDETTKEKDEVIEKISQQAQASLWGATVDIAGIAYTVYTIKPLSYTVTYKEGEQVLGTEVVAANSNPKEYAQYESLPLSTFEGWYKDAELTQAVVSMAAEVISADVTFYAKFSKAYLSKNVNIEQLVLDYGTKYDIKSALTAAGWAYENVDQLDTLNDLEDKAARNEPYLGLKLKTKGAYIMGNLAVDGVLLVKFGNIGCDINVTAKGASVDANDTYKKEDLWSEDDQAYVLPVYGFTEDVLLTITTTDKGTVVLKQLMLDELATVTLPAPGAYLVTCAESENGTIEATWPNKKYRTPVGETVTLTVTPAEGYKVSDVQVDGVSLNAVEGVYSFVMPDKAVTVSATFERLPVVEYNITIAEMQNGSVTADKEKAAEGELVTLTVSPADGYKLNDIQVNGTSLNAEGGVYSFNMPAENVTITATFVEDEPVIVTEYNITIAEMQNGTVTADKAQAAKGEIVTLTVTPAEGYKIADVKVNNVSLNAVEGIYSFEMPEEDVTITASFSSTEGFENIDASKQAVKVILNGQLLIKKGDKLFDAQGAVVK
jgi:uncharacterized repeat protein (TIGR02543 family)